MFQSVFSGLESPLRFPESLHFPLISVHKQRRQKNLFVMANAINTLDLM